MNYEVQDPFLHDEDEWSAPVDAPSHDKAAIAYLRANDITEDQFDEGRRVVMTVRVRPVDDPTDARKVNIGVERKGTGEEFVLGFVVRGAR